jgi:hypothetical protein
MYNHNGAEVSYSKLSLLDQSVVKYYNRYVLNVPEPVKASYRFGSAFDAYMTEPDVFARYKIKDTATTTVDGCITVNEHNSIIKMADSVNRFNNWGSQSEIFGTYTLEELFKLSNSQSELYWLDSGVNCRAKLDYDLILPTNRVIFDLKTTAAETLEDCLKSVFNFKYYLQIAHYLNAAKTLSPELTSRFYLIFVSKTTYETWVLYATPELIEYGNYERSRLISKLVDLEISGEYLKPQPCSDILLPSWIKNKL